MKPKKNSLTKTRKSQLSESASAYRFSKTLVDLVFELTTRFQKKFEKFTTEVKQNVDGIQNTVTEMKNDRQQAVKELRDELETQKINNKKQVDYLTNLTRQFEDFLQQRFAETIQKIEQKGWWLRPFFSLIYLPK